MIGVPKGGTTLEEATAQLVQAVQQFTSGRSLVPWRHVNRVPEDGSLQQLAERVAQLAAKPRSIPTGCCGLIELQGVWDSTAPTIQAYLKRLKTENKYASLVIATTGKGSRYSSYRTAEELAKAGFQPVAQTLNRGYQSMDPGHTTTLWVFDLNTLT